MMSVVKIIAGQPAVIALDEQSVNESGIPPGMVFDPVTRRLSGVPTVTGSYSYVRQSVEAVDVDVIDPPPLISLPPNTGTLLYEYHYDAQSKVDDHWSSAGGSSPPPVVLDAAAGHHLRWPINDTDDWGRLKSPSILIPQSGIVDVDVLMRIPQSWVDLGALPRTPTTPGGYSCPFDTMKLFRLFPLGGGHNATIFGRLNKGDVFLRDFVGDKLTPDKYLKVRPDEWMGLKIRYDYKNVRVELWYYDPKVPAAGWTQVSSEPGGGEKTVFVGPIFHASTRDEDHGYGRHPATYVDYHSYRVLLA